MAAFSLVHSSPLQAHLSPGEVLFTDCLLETFNSVAKRAEWLSPRKLSAHIIKNKGQVAAGQGKHQEWL